MNGLFKVRDEKYKLYTVYDVKEDSLIGVLFLTYVNNIWRYCLAENFKPVEDEEND